MADRPAGPAAGAGYYSAVHAVRGISAGRAGVLAGLGLPRPVLGAVRTPGGSVSVGLVSDSARLRRMFAANWARAQAATEPDAILYALARQPGYYGLDQSWDGARWWSAEAKAMIAFGCGSYRLVKVCVRGICSAVADDDILFAHGCVLALGQPDARRGVIVTGCSGVGKTTLLGELLGRPGYSPAVINDDWGAVSLSTGYAVNTGERRLHMKTASVLAVRPDFHSAAPRRCYAPDLSDPDPGARLLVSPHGVYGANWSAGGTSIEHLAVIVREPPGWAPPRSAGHEASLIRNCGHPRCRNERELFFNGSLILSAPRDLRREERRYQRLANRVRVSWINNCGTPALLADQFISAVMT